MKRVKIKIIKTKQEIFKWNMYLIRVLSHKRYLKRKYNQTGYTLYDVEKYIRLGFNG